MELTSEETVTQLLTRNEILRADKSYTLNPQGGYNLGEFLQNVKNEPSPYEGKYVFIK